MDFFTLLLPIVLIVGLIFGLVLLRRHLFSEQSTPAPIPIPEPRVDGSGKTEQPEATAPSPIEYGAAAPGDNELSLSPARLYPRRLMTSDQRAVFSRLLKSLPGYVVLPKITYDHFLEARDGSASENTSLQNRAAQHPADFVICDRRLNVLLVCQVEDGTHVPARIQERERMLQKAGLRLLRWNVEQPPDPATLLNMVRTLERMQARAAETSG